MQEMAEYNNPMEFFLNFFGGGDVWWYLEILKEKKSHYYLLYKQLIYLLEVLAHWFLLPLFLY